MLLELYLLVATNDILIGRRDGIPYAFEAASIYCKNAEGRSSYLDKEAAAAFMEMTEAAAKDGIELRVTYAFRDHGEQRAIKKRNRRLAARPGFSPHEMGLAVDIAGTSTRGRKTAVHWWLKENAGRFGFEQTVKREFWHWEYLR